MRWTTLLVVVLPALAVAACGGGSGTSAEDAGPLLTIEGRVVGGALTPRPGLVVIVVGHPPVVTDANGRFAVTGVRAPYTACVTGLAAFVTVYRGLTRTDPTLTSESLYQPFKATAEGTVTGGLYPQPANHRTRFYPGTTASGLVGFGDTDVNGAWSSATLSWVGPASTQLHVRALQAEVDVDQVPTLYTGYGAHLAPLGPNDALIMQDIVLQPIGTVHVSGLVTTPAGYDIQNKIAQALLGPGDALNLLNDPDPAPTFDVAVPTISGATFAVSCQAVRTGSQYGSWARRAGLVTDETGVEIVLPEPSDAILPVDGAVGIEPDFVFLTTDRPSRVRNNTFVPVTAGPIFVVYTADAEFELPDLGDYGLAPEGGAEYLWQVIGLGPFADMDAFAGPEGIRPYSDELFETTAPSRTFRLAD